MDEPLFTGTPTRGNSRKEGVNHRSAQLNRKTYRSEHSKAGVAANQGAATDRITEKQGKRMRRKTCLPQSDVVPATTSNLLMNFTMIEPVLMVKDMSVKPAIKYVMRKDIILKR